MINALKETIPTKCLLSSTNYKECLDLFNEAITAHGGEVFVDYFRDGFDEKTSLEDLERSLKEFVSDETERLVEDGEGEKAKRIRDLLRSGKLFEALREVLREYPSWGELAGLAIAYYMRKGEHRKAIELLETCKVDGKFSWDT